MRGDRGSLRCVNSGSALQLQLQKDYETISSLGLRRSTPGSAGEVLDRLVEAGLALREGDYFALQLPQYGSVEFSEETLASLRAHYERWLHAEQLVTGEQVLYGQPGFWQHWWNLLHERSETPLRMDLVIPDLPEYDKRDWVSDLNLDLLTTVLENQKIKVRVLFPPRDPEGTIAELAHVVSAYPLEVRVRSSPFLFVVYDQSSAVLSTRETESEEEGYFLTRRPSIVGPLQQVFEDHWASAIPWDAYVRGASDVLSLMSLGWTDGRIAEAMGLSVRTVARRIADAMAAAGVSSRFELGMKYAQSRGK